MIRLLRLLALYRPFYGWMAVGILVSLATLVANVTLMAVSGWFITSMAVAGAAQTTMNYFTPAAIIRGAAIVRTGGRYVERLVTHEATLRLLAILRAWFYARLEPLAPAVLQRHHGGDLLSRIRADVDTLDNLYLRLVVPVVTAALATLLFTAYIASHDGTLALVLLGCLAAGGVALPWLTLRLGAGPGRRRVALQAAQRVAAIDGIQGMGELLLYGAGDTQSQRLSRLSAATVTEQARLARAGGLSQAGLLLSANLAAWLILWLAVPMVRHGDLPQADLVMLTLFALATFEAVMPLPAALQAYGATQAASRRLFEIVDTPLPVAEPLAPRSGPHRFDIRFEQVAFGYPDSTRPALRHVDFSLAQGERLTVMGPSGAGKSTLVNLLLRFHDPDAGRVLVGGHPVAAYTLDALRSGFAVVSQRTHLFTGTLRDNLRLASPSAGQDQLEAACRVARIHDFIASLPDGYDTWLGEAGATLSGGQARRIAIARAVLKDAPVLILDEPTEGLDASTARDVLALLDRVATGRTVLLITHRRPRGDTFGPVLRIVDGVTAATRGPASGAGREPATPA